MNNSYNIGVWRNFTATMEAMNPGLISAQIMFNPN